RPAVRSSSATSATRCSRMGTRNKRWPPSAARWGGSRRRRIARRRGWSRWPIRPTASPSRATPRCAPSWSASSRHFRLLDCARGPCSKTPVADTQIEEGFFSARDGLRLFWQIWRAPAPAAHVAVLHGYAEHLGRQTEIARALIAGGYTAHLLDCRGHGQSGGKRAHVDRFDEYISDLELFLARVREEARGAPVFMPRH